MKYFCNFLRNIMKDVCKVNTVSGNLNNVGDISE